MTRRWRHSTMAMAALAAGLASAQGPDDGAAERFGDWALTCSASTNASAVRRCRLVNAQVYRAPPNHRAATIAVLLDEAGGPPSLRLELEPGAGVSDTGFTFEPKPPQETEDGLQFLPEPLSQYFLSINGCTTHLCDAPAEVSALLLQAMTNPENAALRWRMRPFDGARPEIRFDLDDFRAAWAAANE